jgi:hypothetical protein
MSNSPPASCCADPLMPRFALVALAAKENKVALATRDARAQGTHDAVGVRVIIVT